MAEPKINKPISVQTLRRLPDYLHYLQSLDLKTEKYVSAATIATSLRLHEVQVRKDLAAVSPNSGKPRAGFEVTQLIQGLENHLGYHRVDQAVLVGAGKLGQALLSYEGFREAGLNIVAAFDIDPTMHHTSLEGKYVFPMDKLVNLCQRMRIHIGIITVPAAHAQEVCDLLIEGGIMAIWNFAPVNLKVPDAVYMRNENMAASLAMISQYLKQQYLEVENEGARS